MIATLAISAAFAGPLLQPAANLLDDQTVLQNPAAYRRVFAVQLRNGDAACTWLGDPFQSRGDVDAISHQVAVGLLHDVPKVDADTELDAPFRRQAGVALDHAGLHFDRTARRVDHTAKLNDDSVAGALDNAAVMEGDGRVDEVATEFPHPRERALFLRPSESAVTDHVGDQNCRELRASVIGPSSGSNLNKISDPKLPK